MKPLVSVVVATYKRDKELVSALESLFLQVYDNFEIVLVDDNGNAEWNKTVKGIVDDFREKHPLIALIHIINSPNRGSAETRNIGITAANGEYITFLDDDDVYLPEKILRQVEYMKNGRYDYSVTDLYLYNQHDKLIDKRIRSYIKDTSAAALQKYHLMYHLTGTDTMMFEKNYLQKIGGFAPIDVGDEFYLMQRAIEGNGKFGYLSGCDIKAYVHIGEGGLSSGESKIRGENALYQYKQQYFHRLSKLSCRYIKMRHYSVIAFAEIRRKCYLPFMVNAIRAFIIAPLAFTKMIFLRR